ncbi:hypothetical protein ACN6K5_003782 [Streptomyces violaceoruber]|uniref:hypothetical protein n=1 Tax=Streptomyces violaceoruber group TaxID=2867121 RepID=UPI0034011365
MPDALHQRYMKALDIHRDHRAACATCTNASRCRDGQRLWDAFTRSQDAYLARQKQQR